MTCGRPTRRSPTCSPLQSLTRSSDRMPTFKRLPNKRGRQSKVLCKEPSAVLRVRRLCKLHQYVCGHGKSCIFAKCGRLRMLGSICRRTSRQLCAPLCPAYSLQNQQISLLLVRSSRACLPPTILLPSYTCLFNNLFTILNRPGKAKLGLQSSRGDMSRNSFDQVQTLLTFAGMMICQTTPMRGASSLLKSVS